MKAILDGRILADSDDIVEAGGYHYFPRSAVRMEWLEPAEKTARDLQCPHGVRFFDVGIEGERHARVAGSYVQCTSVTSPLASFTTPTQRMR